MSIRDKYGISFIQGDICRFDEIRKLLRDNHYDVIFNLAAYSHVGESFDELHQVMITNGYAVNNILEVLREISSPTKFLQASSVEIYGSTSDVITEESKPQPVSPYGVAKLFAHDCVRLYREAYGLFSANAILSNMESVGRSDRFITRKVSKWAAALHHGKPYVLHVGNLDAKRDWSHVSDFMRGMLMMAEQENPEDYVFGSERSMSVRTFISKAADLVGRTIFWSGHETNEIGTDQNGNILVMVDPKYYRASDISERRICAAKARKNLGWSPVYNVNEIINNLVTHDIENYHAYPKTQKSNT